MKNFKPLPTKSFLCNFSWHFFRCDFAQKKVWTNISNRSGKCKALLKNRWNLTIMKSVQFFHGFFGILCLGSKVWYFEENGSITGPILYLSTTFFGPNHFKDLKDLILQNIVDLFLILRFWTCVHFIIIQGYRNRYI